MKTDFDVGEELLKLEEQKGGVSDVSELSLYRGGQTDTSKIEPYSYLKKGSDLQLLECTIEWAVDRLLPKQSIILLHGRGGGKTWLSLIMADSISKAIPFMGLDVQRMRLFHRL